MGVSGTDGVVVLVRERDSRGIVDVHMTRRTIATAAAIFAAVACLLLVILRNRLIFSNDEGIILDAAQRMLRGQRLYVDFFGYMSPGSYWLQELVFRCFGFSLSAGRLIVIFDFALQCALLFWLLARLGYAKTGLAATALFFLFEASNPTLILPAHRWDSAALSLFAVAMALEGMRSGKRAWWIASGALGMFAAICTPSIGLVAGVTFLAALTKPHRRHLLAFVLGGTAVSTGAICTMAATGILQGFLAQMRWLGANYSGVNRMPYGSVLGGYHALLADMAGAPIPIRVLLLVCVVLPGVLPIVSLTGWAAALRTQAGRALPASFRFEVLYLLAAMVAYVAATYPRSDMMHLTWVAPLAYVLSALLVALYCPPGGRLCIFLALFCCAILPAIQSVREIAEETSVRTPVGELRSDPETANALRKLVERVRPGQTLFVHPYMPLLYFLTQTVNPTRFSYLEPGMMTEHDETQALEELKQSPPDWVLYLPLDIHEYRKLFLSGNTYRFERIEDWLRANYAPVDQPIIASYRLLSKRTNTDR